MTSEGFARSRSNKKGGLSAAFLRLGNGAAQCAIRLRKQLCEGIHSSFDKLEFTYCPCTKFVTKLEIVNLGGFVMRNVLFGLVFASACVSLTAYAQDVKKVDAADLSVQSNKWVGKKLETKLRCFFADVSDYRCVGGNARVDFSTITNEDGKKHLEDNCDTVQKATRSQCQVTIRFVYGSNERPSNKELTLIRAENDEGEVLVPSKRR